MFLKQNINAIINYTRYSMDLASRFDVLSLSLALKRSLNNLQLQLLYGHVHNKTGDEQCFGQKYNINCMSTIFPLGHVPSFPFCLTRWAWDLEIIGYIKNIEYMKGNNGNHGKTDWGQYAGVPLSQCSPFNLVFIWCTVRLASKSHPSLQPGITHFAWLKQCNINLEKMGERDFWDHPLKDRMFFC